MKRDNNGKAWAALGETIANQPRDERPDAAHQTLMAEAYFRERAARANPARALKLLVMIGKDVKPRRGDEPMTPKGGKRKAVQASVTRKKDARCAGTRAGSCAGARRRDTEIGQKLKGARC
jgi:hypothetical protein